MNKETMQKAKDNKKDDFFTSYETIEEEMKYYTDFFENKIVYCNTDDTDSNFWKYFDDNFEKFKLKKLVATKYNQDDMGEKYELFIENGNKKYCKTKLIGNGSFDSEECLKILQQSDVVITNPPFSLFRDFIKILDEYDKKFIILGNLNSITYKKIYEMALQEKIRFGITGRGGKAKKFRVHKDYDLCATGENNCWIDEHGNKFIRVSGIRWFTNLNHNVEPPFLNLTKKYNEKDYPKYDNKDAINVNKTKDIPYDYDGLIGVPITFLDKYNSKQFEIVDFCKGDDDKDLRINGKRLYFRILIRKR